MRVLVACLNINGLGGSELYHYELVRGLAVMGADVKLFTLRNIQDDPKRDVLTKLGVKQYDARSKWLPDVDIVVCSQPDPTVYMLDHYNGLNGLPKTPVIQIVHSEIRSETPILNDGIRRYISIRQPISDVLMNDYDIPTGKISLIYNPIDTTSFKRDVTVIRDSTAPPICLFVGEVLDPIRFKAVKHLVESRFILGHTVNIVSKSRYDFNMGEKYFDTTEHIRHFVYNCDYTAGILLGRTTLEGLHCGKPGMIYNINAAGDILSIDMVKSGPKMEELVKLSTAQYVVQQHIDLYNEVINERS